MVTPLVVYFSSASENTHRFVQKLAVDSVRIPIHDDYPLVRSPFVLIIPTYGAQGKSGGHVPAQVVRFLGDEGNRSYLRGVIAGGNSNFGTDFGKAGDIVALKCQVPYLYRFELLGTPEDVTAVTEGLEKFFQQECVAPVPT